MIVKLVIFLFNRVKLSNSDRILLVNAILERIGALPVRDSILVREDGKLVVGGREVDLETAKILRESARAALSSTALRVVKEQVTYSAVTTAVHQASDPWHMIFGKTAIWYNQQLEVFLKILAGVADDETESMV